MENVFLLAFLLLYALTEISSNENDTWKKWLHPLWNPYDFTFEIPLDFGEEVAGTSETVLPTDEPVDAVTYGNGIGSYGITLDPNVPDFLDVFKWSAHNLTTEEMFPGAGSSSKCPDGAGNSSTDETQSIENPSSNVPLNREYLPESVMPDDGNEAAATCYPLPEQAAEDEILVYPLEKLAGIPLFTPSPRNEKRTKLENLENERASVQNTSERGKGDVIGSDTTAADSPAADTTPTTPMPMPMPATTTPPTTIKTNAFTYCTLCNVSFRYTKHYARHSIEKHGNFYPYNCPHCPERCRNKFILISHVTRVHGRPREYDDDLRVFMKPIKCEACQTTFQGCMALERHNLTVHKGRKMITCQICQKKFARRQILLKHERDHHSDISTSYSWQCKHCKNTFQHTDALMEHEKRCEKRRKVTNTITINPNRKNGKHEPCRLCGAEFTSFKYFKDHYASTHPESKLFQCNYCEEAYQSEKPLEKHFNKWHRCDKAETNILGGAVLS